MSEIRLQSPSLFQSYTPFNVGVGTSTSNLGLEDAGTSPFISNGSSLEMFGAAPGTLASNPFSAGPLLQLQSQTASSITHPEGSPAESGHGGGSDLHSAGETTSRGVKTTATVLKTVAKAGSHLGRAAGGIGPAAALLGAPLILPGQYSQAGSSIGEAWRTGETSDIIKAGGDASYAGTNSLKTVKAGIDTYNAVNSSRRFAGYQARTAAGGAFRQAAPGASKAVVNAAARQAAQEALKESGEKAARRATTAAATTAAKKGGTLARGAGATGRAAARTVLSEGGESAAKAAAKAVGRSALKTGAKAAARFVPGLNIGIAALDTAVAGATLADPKASIGKKATSVITAAGSIVAATNIPVVSQVGAAVSAVSSFVGSFF